MGLVTTTKSVIGIKYCFNCLILVVLLVIRFLILRIPLLSILVVLIVRYLILPNPLLLVLYDQTHRFAAPTITPYKEHYTLDWKPLGGIGLD